MKYSFHVLYRQLTSSHQLLSPKRPYRITVTWKLMLVNYSPILSFHFFDEINGLEA